MLSESYFLLEKDLVSVVCNQETWWFHILFIPCFNLTIHSNHLLKTSYVLTVKQEPVILLLLNIFTLTLGYPDQSAMEVWTCHWIQGIFTSRDHETAYLQTHTLLEEQSRFKLTKKWSGYLSTFLRGFWIQHFFSLNHFACGKTISAGVVRV